MNIYPALTYGSWKDTCLGSPGWPTNNSFPYQQDGLSFSTVRKQTNIRDTINLFSLCGKLNRLFCITKSTVPSYLCMLIINI